ncbi:MAG: HigA family addiction module antitoxin [Parvibaculaceae bacterium]
MTKKEVPMHPGEVLREEFMKPLGLTAYAVAKAVDVPRTRIERIEREETAVTADTAHRLGRYFRTTPQFWLNLQTEYELRLSAAQLAKTLDRIQPVAENAA